MGMSMECIRNNWEDMDTNDKQASSVPRHIKGKNQQVDCLPDVEIHIGNFTFIRFQHWNPK